MIHSHLLRYEGARFLWWSLGLVAASLLLFVTQDTLRGVNGGTWQGYVLGTTGALLIAWLTLLGIRKRSYSSRLGSLKGWTSAHIYLGTALVVVATLHCAAQFGNNVHTLAYVLMCLVVASGFFGVYAYLNFPRSISDNREGGSRSELFAELYELDRQGRDLARKCDGAVSLAVRSCVERTTIGGGALHQLSGRDRSRFLRTAPESPGSAALADNDDQQAVIAYVADRIPRADKRAEAANLQALVSMLCRRQAVLRRLRRDIRLHAWLRVWLYLHVPLTLALLAALVVHVVTTFIYW